ncbi:MAG: cellulase family glycosylhydrolase, partial [Planctomycetota bacterium]
MEYLKTVFSSLILALLFASSCAPLSAQTVDCRLVAQGTQIVNAATGEPVILRSVGLGNWLLQEGYMLNPGGCAGCPGTQWQMKLQYLNEGQSDAQIEDFYQQWRDNFITEADINYIASLGFNSVRLPMHYELFLTEEQRAVRNSVITSLNAGHDQYKSALQSWLDNNTLFINPDVEGFQVIDRLVDWCEQNDMYVILDLHAAPGAQGTDLNICDGFHSNNLWEFPVFQDVTEQLWLSISSRYRGEPRIAMYEFVNEPNNVPGGNQAIHALTQRLIATVRANEDDHLIGVHGNGWGNNYDLMEPQAFWPNWGIVYSAHRYGIDPVDDWVPDPNPNQINKIINLINYRETHRVPVWVGETGENSSAWMAQNFSKLENAGVGWCHWTYKRHDWQENPALLRIGGNYPTDGARFMSVVLNNIRFENLSPNTNTLATVSSYLPPAGTTGCGATVNGPPVGREVWFRGSNGRYVSSENGQVPMNCDRDEAGAWERFVVEDAGFGKIALRGNNGLYVSCENGQSPMTCNRAVVSGWERFDWVEFADGRIGLRGINGRYVSSENGNSEMTCVRENDDSWEKFIVGMKTEVPVDGFSITRGNHFGGEVDDLLQSDDSDLQANRSNSTIQSQVEFEFSASSPVADPSSVEFSIESAVVARSEVNLTVSLFDFEQNEWVEMQTVPAA